MADQPFNADFVATVRETADALEVVGEHVRLRRRGRRWEGLCPFHEEKTPSFSVDPEKGLYYCFGCHAGGDVISFVMRLERLEFFEAVEQLARRFGVPVPARSPQASRQQREVQLLGGLLGEAQQWFEDQLAGPGAGPAREELERRGFASDTWSTYGFGYAPDDWRQLLDHLSRRHPEGTIVRAGLAAEKESGSRPYDRFRNRITFPIRASDGRMIAFGGRALEGEPKYLNSPESVLFAKRRTLFCLDRARRTITDRGEALVVEGYFDCLSLHRVGICHAVATLGTALSPEHARLLRRLVGSDGRVLLCYDADAAGRRAAAAGAGVLLEAGVEVAVVALEGGKDPDDIVREAGAAAIQTMLDRAQPVLRFLLRDLPADPARRRRAGLSLAPLVCSASNPACRRNLIEELARELYLSPREIEEQGRKPARAKDPPPVRQVLSSISAGERFLARVLVEGSGAWRQQIVATVEPAFVKDERVRELLLAAAEVDVSDDGAVVLDRCQSTETRLLVAELANTDFPEINDEIIETQLRVLASLQDRERARQLAPLITEAERRGDTEELARLQSEMTQLRQKACKASPDSG